MDVRRSLSALALVTALGLAPGSPPGLASARAGDPEVAQTLFKSGRQAFQKGDYDGAAKFFAKAAEEDESLVEAIWWTAASREKSGDKASALGGYREFLARCAAKAAAGPTSREEQRLEGLARKSVDALAAGEKDFRKLEDAYVGSLLQFAKDHFVRDPGAALKAIGLLLDVRPDHADAQKLREKLGGDAADAPAADPSAAPGPFRDVKKWKDLLADRTLKTDRIEYSGSLMTVDTKGGAVLTPSEFRDYGSAYAYESEIRVLEVYDRGWLSGLTFATRSGTFYSAFFESSRVALLRSRSQEDQEDVAAHETPPLDVNAWHRLGVIVRGPEVEVWLDGKRVIRWTEPGGGELVGELGIFQQRCRTERRVYRAARLD